MKQQFTINDLPLREQFDAFSAFFDPIAEVVPTSETRGGFSFDFKTVAFERMTLVDYRRDGAASRRESSHIRRDAVDHIGFACVRRGRISGSTGEREYSLGPGRLAVRDYAQPFTALSDNSDVVILTVPRRLVATTLGDIREEHARIYQGGAMGLLHDHILSLAANAEHLTVDAVANISLATEQLIAAALSPSRDGFKAAEAPIADLVRRRALRYIERNLYSPELTPDRIATAVGVSRRKLYQVLEPEGGVARCVLGLRLEGAREMLSGGQPRLIKDIAFSSGFQSEAHFARSFKLRFGHSPSEAFEAEKQRRLAP